MGYIDNYQDYFFHVISNVTHSTREDEFRQEHNHNEIHVCNENKNKTSREIHCENNGIKKPIILSP